MSNIVISDIYPLSPTQSGLLFETLSSLESDVYVVQSVFELEGELDISILKQAWQVVNNHHTTLRTGFIWKDGDEPCQYVLGNLEVPFIFYDYSALSEIDRENKLELLIKMDREKAYDLAKAPLYRVYLVKDHDKKHYLIWSQHHILIDGWSTPIILADVLKAYSQINLGKSLILEHRPPYRNYIAWLQQQELQAAKDFWVQYLSSINEPTRLSFNSMINNKPEYSYADHEINLSSLDSEKIREFTKKYRITLNTLFQGAVGAVIKNYTQSSEVVFGITVSGRNIDLANVEDMVGLFINTMPLKINFKNNEDILSFLRRLQNDTQSINNYSYTPLADIQNWTKIHQSLFDVILVFENYPISEEVTNIPLDFTIKNVQGIEKTEYPLTIVVSPGEQINIILSYQTEHYNEYIIHNIAKHIEQVLLSIISLKKYGLQDISLLSKEERKHILVDWNETNVDFPSNKTIQQMFEEQVVRTPANIAVVYENKKLSYKQLNDKSNQLAHYLRCIGVGPDVLVAIAADRCNEMIIGLLGILKAGGAYVPIDPSYPQARIEFMLEDTRASVLLATSSMRSRLDFYKGNVIFIDEQDTWKKLSKQPKDNPSIINTPNHLAYLIYTSGSTGNPKGVMVPHVNLINLIVGLSHKLSINSSTKMLASTTISFDIAALEIYSPIIKGASICIVRNDTLMNKDDLEKIIDSNNITTIQATPTIWKNLLEHNWVGRKNINIFCGGEKANTKILKDLSSIVNNVFNLYGPTETTIWSSYQDYSTNNNFQIPILGKPIDNTKIYILDTVLEPVPIGVMGEIYIAGVGLARGYLNNPGLTAEKFIANPFATPQDISLGYTRLYRTGDIGRYLPDGNIEYKGRIDDQVKIRGFRIELGEIENALNHYTDIEHSVVVSDGDDGNKHLVAYVVPTKEIRKQLSQETQFISSAKDTCSTLTGDIAPSMSEALRGHLSTTLPDYMIPAFFVYIDKIPLTSNGKIDRKSLPAPDLSLRLVTEQYVEPRNDVERELCNIWKDVLNVSQVGIYDNFFGIGGHSLYATQIITRVKGFFDVEIPFKSLFEHPTIYKLSKIIISILRKTDDNKYAKTKIIPTQKKCSIPLSFAQSRLWFLDQISMEKSLYNIPVAIKISGRLDVHSLEKSLNHIIDRHQVLRTVFVSEDGKAYQVITPSVQIDITNSTIDLSDMDITQQEISVHTIAERESLQQFDLSTGPLVRVKLIILNETENILLFTFHHIIFDGWSMDIFFDELSSLYNAHRKGKQPSLPNLPIQYVDFSVWQRDFLQGDKLEHQLSYWSSQLGLALQLIELPVDKARPKILTYTGGSYRFSLSSDMINGLRDLASSNQSSLFMVLLAGFQALLYRYTGQNHIVVGVPIANRHYREVEELIGFFVNMLAMKTSFNSDDDWLEILAQVKNTTLEAYQYQDVPFEKLVEHLNISRALNIHPVFQVIFNFQSSSTKRNMKFDELEIKPFERSYPITKFDLSLNVYEGNNNIQIEFEYMKDLFNPETIERMAEHFHNLLKDIVKKPSKKILSLLLLSKEERKHILVDWNETNVDFPSNKTIQQMFEEQVVRTPANIAVVYENKKLSYKQLNDKSNQLAHYLRCIGVGPDVLVAIAADRCNEMIIGLLGILKAGGAYVPIDPSYPQARIEFMLEDTRASVLLATSSMRSRLDFYKGNVIFIDEQDTWKKLSKQPKDNPSIINTPNHLAYLIYTSGSTGNPKGVMVPHVNLINLIVGLSHKLSINSSTKMLASTTISFDIAALEIYSPIIKGASICIVRNDTLMNKDDLEKIIDSNNITTIQATPTIWKNLLEHNWVGRKNINIFCGGEKANTKILKDLSSIVNNVFNLYGPTETTIWSSYQDYSTNNNFQIPILGKPIDNTKIYILDTVLEPVPIGVMGEIYIAGVGLARGYLNNPGLTAEKFIANPFATPQDISLGYTRLYRTGDIGRYLPDGNIEYKGRIDDQVKIRGFRIELGEIENALNHYTDIEHSVVVSDGDDGNKHLVAYVVPTKEIRKQLSQETQFISSAKDTCSTLTGDIAPSMSEALRGHLSTTLPDYMIPAFFVYIDKIPLTSNGKIDRKSLPAPDLSLRLVTEQYVEPRNDVERELCNIWKDVLNVSQVGIYDNFFGIGGDSIISIQVVSRARLKGLYFSIKDIFSNPTIIELSKVTTKENTCGGIQAEQGLISGSVPLTPIQHWFFSAKLDDNNHFNQAVMLEVSSKVNADMINKAINLLIKHHDALRHRYTKDKQRKWTQACIEINQEFDTDIISISNSLSDKETLDKISDKSTSIHKQIDIENGPLIRTALFNCEDSNNQTLLIVIHHLVVDGVSWRILIEDLNRICEDILLDKNPTLPQKTHSYKQWAELLTEYASSNDIKKEYSYWNNLVINIKALPTDFENKHATVGDMITVQTSLTEQETDVMLHKVPNAYNTQVNDILLTALTLAIGDWSNFYEIFLSLEGHGREDISNDIDTSRTVGWFTTIFPVYLKIEEPNDIGESIKAIKEELRAIPNKGIGYGILAYLLDKAVLNSHDNPSISFNYLGQWDNVSLKDNLFMHSPKPSGQSVSPINKQSHLIDINAEIRNNKLDFFISYSNKHYKHQTIENIASLLSKRLRQLIDHCNQDNTIGYTPSDFDLGTISQNEVDDLLKHIPIGVFNEKA